MSNITISTNFNPKTIKANTTSEISMDIMIKLMDEKNSYWCESDIEIEEPLSLAPHKRLSKGRRRMGIIKSGSDISQKINIYSDSTNFPNEYNLKVITYVYGEDGTIVERIETPTTLSCE